MQESTTWGSKTQRLMSCLLAFHLCSVAHAGLVSYLPDKLNQALGLVFAPYLNSFFLGHQFAFYGPEPNPSMVMNAKSVLRDGSIEERWYHTPDRYDSMLLYIRFQNLAGALAGPPLRSIPIAASYARHLCAADVRRQSVQIARVLHRPRTLDEMRREKNPNDTDTFLQPIVMGNWPCPG